MNENRVKRNRLLGDRVIRGLEFRRAAVFPGEDR